MHVNIYSTEGGITEVNFGVKDAKDGKTYPFVGLTFSNGNSVKFFGKTLKEVTRIVQKLVEALDNLEVAQAAYTSPLSRTPLS